MTDDARPQDPSTPHPLTRDDHLAANRANWNDRAAAHSTRTGLGYGVQRFIDDRALLSDVVSFDRERLGAIEGLTTVHLQCHIGTDTLSLARLGARVTGLDFSPTAIAEARRLVEETGDEVDFVESDVASALSALTPESFDLVYTGIGALCWLPLIAEWAGVVAGLLKPGGRLFLREGHPILWAMDETLDDDLHLRFPYWEHERPLEWDDDASYVPTDRPLTATKTYEWNHGLGEIVTALLDSGLVLTMLVEHDSVPWEALPGQMVERPDGEYALSDRAGVAPLSYTLQAVKPAR
ncbi:class I SAM-dependent methyltransferase [Herbiconiux sp. KACC 21604]|uniref:class I SAM-dependent methyltransferase n=1 Tax=unclassified Herbiconiux TaxID=2618217 RepID=UPI001490B66F|nr:class I SAM-dependent methyltransferase [Herbiconiux sp. SALV-R1]QJU54199.1 class I SAM-dependent methyltransferase [Herbiconiux sp. SALV-R1]WPO85257.1 class I SAM-dependent methyltransferase [Herbiconiux sp. KACC 21604]